MKSPEQMGGPPEQSKEDNRKNEENLERKLTSPEEAAEMTRQRRIAYGLKETSELTAEELKKIDNAIKELLDRLNEYDFDGLSSELQEEWYWVATEAETGKDRELAKAVLEKFLNTLKEREEKK